METKEELLKELKELETGYRMRAEELKHALNIVDDNRKKDVERRIAFNLMLAFDIDRIAKRINGEIVVYIHTSDNKL